MSDAPVLLRADDLSKWFGATRALREASVEVRAGEIHALVGANGSGKSTVVRILAGAVSPDSGSVTRPDPLTALGTVHQNLGLFQDATVRENVCGGLAGRVLLAGRERRSLSRIFEQIGVAIPGEVPVRQLPIDQQAFVAVARALAKMGDAPSAVLIVDEVTSVLRGSAAKRFAEVLTRLRTQGIGVLIVSHDIDEILELADRVTVLVDGAVRAVESAKGLGRQELIEMMTGSAVLEAQNAGTPEPADGDAVLQARGLGGDLLHDLDLDVSAGEIVGVIGVPGSGYDETPYLLAGAGSERRRGRVLVGGQPVDSPSAFARAGGSLIPADRNRTALVHAASVLENFMLGHRGGQGSRGLLSPRRERAAVNGAGSTFGVKCEGPSAPVTSLSGGNQQKLILARCLEAQPGLLVVHEPTQGVDVRARADLLAHIHKAAVTRGLAVVYVCGDLNEVWENAHRVVVVRRGTKVADVQTANGSMDVVHHYLY
jgi:ribose transport system ATP-binding protein